MLGGITPCSFIKLRVIPLYSVIHGYIYDWYESRVLISALFRKHNTILSENFPATDTWLYSDGLKL